MHNIEYYQLLILIAQCLVVAAFLLIFFRLRTIFGLGLFYIAIGLFKFMHYFFTQAFSLEIAPGIHILIGPTVITSAILFSLLLIYIREDAGEVRKIVYALIFFNFFFAVMMRISALGINGAGFENILNLPEHFFRMDIGSLIAGSLVLFIDGIVLIVFYEFISKKISSLFLRIFLTMTTVIFLHALIFNSVVIIFRPVDVSLLQEFAKSTLISKAISIPVYTVTFWLYIFYFEKRVDNLKKSGSSFRDVFNLLTYRQKYALTQDKLKESEEKYRKLTENTSFGIGVSMGTKLIFANKKLLDLFKVDSIDRFNEKPPLYYLTPESREKNKERMRKISQGVEVYNNFEVDIIRTDGEQRTLELGFTNITIDGEPCRLSTYNDITERVQAEEALRESRERLNHLFTVNPAMVYELDPENFSTTWVSSNVTEITGYTPEEVSQPGFWAEHVHPEDREKTKKAQERLMVEDRVAHEYRFEKKDGTYIWVRDELRLLRDEQGTPKEIVGSWMNITDRKEAEIALAKSEQRYRSVVENTGTAMLIVNEDGSIAFANKQSTATTGYSPEELQGTDWRGYVFADDLPMMENYFRLRFSDPEKAPNRYETRMIHADGSTRICLLTADIIQPTRQVVVSLLDITERKQAEEKLKASENRLKEAEKIAHLGHWELDITNNVLIWSDEVFRMFDIKPQEFEATYEAFLDHIHPDDREKVNEAYKNSLKTKTNYEIEHRLLLKNGEIKHVLEKCITEYDDTGKPIRSIGTVLDITERKQAEEALKESELKFQKIISESFAGISVVNEEGKIIVWNTALEKITGIKSTETVGRYMWDVEADNIYHEKNANNRRKEVKSTLLNVLKTGKAPWLHKVMEREYVHTDGTIKIVSGSMYTIKTQKGYLIVSISEDVTERKQAEKALKEAQSNLQALLDNRKDSIWSLDRNYNYLVFNKPYADVIYSNLGVRLEKGMNALDIHPKEVADFWKPKFDEVFQGKYVTFEFSHVLDGEEHFFEVYMNPIYTDGEVTGLSALSMDITERKQAEEELKNYREHLEELVKKRTEELQSSNKELEAFAYSVSHDLRAPLRAIDGFTRILMEDYVEKLDDEGKRLGDIIRKNAQKMGNLIDDLLAFSRLGRASMHFSNIDMKNMVNAIYHELTSSSERKLIKFAVADLPDAYGDTNMLRQVWMNLISNAIKFSSKREKAVISITGMQDDEKTTYIISDNGVGFDMQYADKIFDVFQRLHGETEYPGTGVGLSIVQRIIHRHKGKIWAESEIDKGATFYFLLPKKGINESEEL